MVYNSKIKKHIIVYGSKNRDIYKKKIWKFFLKFFEIFFFNDHAVNMKMPQENHTNPQNGPRESQSTTNVHFKNLICSTNMKEWHDIC